MNDIIDGAAIRAALIRSGLLRPNAVVHSFITPLKHPPEDVFRMDETAKQIAAERIKRGY